MTRSLESMLDAVLDGVVLLDIDGDIEFLNPEACRLLETSPTTAIAGAIEDLIGANHAIAKLARSVLASGRSAIEREYPIERRTNEDVLVDVAASPLMVGENIDGVALILRDCTIHNTLAEQVQQRETLSSFGRIAAGIAHEVKNPLGGIRGAAEILGARAGDEKSRQAAELIVREVDRIAVLLEDFMVFTRGEDLRVAPVNIHQVLDDVLAVTQLDSIADRIEISREFDPSIPEFIGDGDRLVQIFLNLVQNALQAMEDEGGTLVITTRMTLDQRLSSPDGQHVPTLLVELVDTGPGIEPAVLEKLATPFYSTRPGGTGLGLAVARHWVARHEGTLRIESAPGLGAAVRVALPLKRPS